MLEGPCNHPWWLGGYIGGAPPAMEVGTCLDCGIHWARAKELGWEPGELKLAEGEMMVTSWRGKDGKVHTEVRKGPEE